MYAELRDFTLNVENGGRPPFDTSESHVAICPSFAAEHLSQF